MISAMEMANLKQMKKKKQREEQQRELWPLETPHPPKGKGNRVQDYLGRLDFLL